MLELFQREKEQNYKDYINPRPDVAQTLGLNTDGINTKLIQPPLTTSFYSTAKFKVVYIEQQ